MDQLMQKLFPTTETAGADFKNEGGVYNTMLRGNFTVDVNGDSGLRPMTMAQTMTYLGRSKVEMCEGPTDVDGLNKNFLTPEGNINFIAVSSALKSHSGLQSQNWSSHVNATEHWPWRDNHVSLLVNMLRFAILAKLAEANVLGGLTGSLPNYDDGHVKVDRNLIFGKDYPLGGAMKWPMHDHDDSIPDAEPLDTYVPAVPWNVLDLRNLTTPEARFVVYMTCRWQRQSRYLLDFDAPKLTNCFHYRHGVKIENTNMWTTGTTELEPLPAVFTSAQAWVAMTKYITLNKLYNQFSTALHLVTTMMTQMVPATVEGHVWLAEPRVIRMPRLNASRARYIFLTEGEASFVSHRALSEWAYLNGSMEKINLMGMIMTQAMQTGLAIRSLRHNAEDQPDDLAATYPDISHPQTFFAAAASEALRVPVPLSGMSDVYVTQDVDGDAMYGERSTVVTVAHKDTLKGYRHRVTGSTTRILVDHLPLAGVPTLLLPLRPMYSNTPFALSGAIKSTDMKKNKNGWAATPYEAWNWAWAARLCGYDIAIRGAGLNDFGGRFYAPNESGWTWPLMAPTGFGGEDMTVISMTPRPNNFIMLPAIHTKSFIGELKYRFSVQTHHVSLPNRMEPSLISDYNGSCGILATTHMRISTPANILKLRGFISRGEQDFQFVNAVQAGVIPDVAEDTAVVDAGGG
ncbi:putative capsid protein [Cronartium ribicola totivirus 5]|uniref:Putative capsid protein n=1 Tax=Cronartium ribicola totivirus 5 TaxID=2687251 RepID=A0A6B9EY01_9VIRU|nr:putative capsid protein [Cronartium ribicola totivirus 5]